MFKFFIKYKRSVVSGLAQLLIVFVGITASLLVDDWREKKAEKELEHQYLRSLYSDLSKDLQQLPAIGASYNKKSRMAISLLEAMHFPDSIALTSEEFKRTMNQVTRLDNFTSADNTYQDLISTGNIRLIADPSLRNRIFEYYRTLEEITKLEDINNQASSELTLGLFKNDFSVRNVYHYGFYNMNGIPDDLDLSLIRDPNSSSFIQFENLLLFRYSFLAMQGDKYLTAFLPLIDLQKDICRMTGIPHLDDLKKFLENDPEFDLIKYHEKKKIEFPELCYVELSLNEWGYENLNNGKINSALKIFDFVIYLFPESSNAYDSRGEAFMNSGNFERARLDYAKSLEIDPSNKNAEFMLDSIALIRAQ